MDDDEEKKEEKFRIKKEEEEGKNRMKTKPRKSVVENEGKINKYFPMLMVLNI